MYEFIPKHNVITLRERLRAFTVADNTSGNQGENEKMNDVERERHLRNQDHSSSHDLIFFFLFLW